jgi:mono/diheme cytochrome c family protein
MKKITFTTIYFLLLSLTASILMQCQSHSDAASGKEIYKRYCVTCHGIHGDLKTNGARDLNYSVLSLEERILVITEGRNVMTPFKSILSPSQIRAVAEFTLGFKTKADGSGN